jgi:peptidoglycan/xylan/chitin deacetylase (PgdA/CDA1 family)
MRQESKVLASVGIFVVMLTVASYGGEIALSFDDAPRGSSGYYTGLKRTEVLLDKLAKLGIPQVVFFCNSAKLDSDSGRARLQMYSDAGYLIANHTHNHPDLNSMGAKRFIVNIKRADELLRGFPTYVKWLRFPYLHEGKTEAVRDSVRDALINMGYKQGYVTVDNYDWYLDKKLSEAIRDSLNIHLDRLRDVYVDMLWGAIQQYDQIAVESTGRSPKHVLLLHENDVAALFIGDLVARIRENGWSIISPKEAYSDPIADYIPDVMMLNQGRVAAIAVDVNYEGPLWHESEDETYLDSLLSACRVFE